MKKLNETFIYRKMPDYGKDLAEFILKGERVNKSNESFSDIKYEVKRKNVDSTLTKLLDSDRVVLVIPNKPIPKALKVFTASDIRTDKKVRVFIDCSGIIEPSGNGYRLINNNASNYLISYLIAGRTAFIMEAKPESLTLNTALTQSGTKAFAALVNYVVDYIGKININTDIRNKSLYLASVYYQVSLLGKEPDSDSVRNTAMKIAGISERQANMYEIDFEEDSFDDIEKFVNLMKDSLHVKGLTIDSFIEKWMFLYNTSTLFAMEVFTYFAQMMSDTYIGAYLNNQKTIEKVCKQNMIEFTKKLIDIGSDS